MTTSPPPTPESQPQSQSQFQFSSNVTDHASARADLAKLLRSEDPVEEVGGSGKWTLTPSKTGLERDFKFRTFADAWAFMSQVAEKCKKERHHPEWFNCYNEVKITWTTHRPKGLSEKDILMAGFCDEVEREVKSGGK